MKRRSSSKAGLVAFVSSEDSACSIDSCSSLSSSSSYLTQSSSSSVVKKQICAKDVAIMPVKKREKKRKVNKEPEVMQTFQVTSPSLNRKAYGFKSCLGMNDDSMKSPENADFSRVGINFLLRRSLSIRELEDKSWLSSSLIDLVMSKFAKHYREIYFMPIDFVVLSMTSLSEEDINNTVDMSGQKIDLSTRKPIIFVCNSQNIHWNTIRVAFLPQPELQLFEPMGKPAARRVGLNFRVIPRGLIKWLDICSPLPDSKSWLSVGLSAITTQQQFTTYDCGVACLLYAEKCAQGQTKEQINEMTSQKDITEYRKEIKMFVAEG